MLLVVQLYGPDHAGAVASCTNEAPGYVQFTLLQIMLTLPSSFTTGAGSGALPVGLPSLPKGLDSWQRGSWAQVAIGWVRHGPRSDFEVETQVAPSHGP